MNQHSWLYSDTFLKRAFAIWGHFMVAHLIIGAIFGVVILTLAIGFGLSLSVPDVGDRNDIEIDYQPVLPD